MYETLFSIFSIFYWGDTLIKRSKSHQYLERNNYEARIDALQRQVEEQSMTMSMYSSYTAEEFTHDEDIFVSK
ncbi:hypothetical protein Avbf_06710 [Armadillidium vulgare]|nr:hypothetical protein Avbf_16614 [Armadillidium vulgare]RXG74036.1 hypothetical protein Avbf_06710 [Armadillidium vulgare]